MGYSHHKYPEEFACKPGGKVLRLYRTWYDMLKRCREGAREAGRYYNLGIRVCKEWRDWPTFAKWARANGYADNLEIDRIKNHQGYFPGNCRWVSEVDQVLNRRCHKNVLCVETGKVYRSQVEAASDTGLCRQAISDVLLGRRGHKTAGGFTWKYQKRKEGLTVKP